MLVWCFAQRSEDSSFIDHSHAFLSDLNSISHTVINILASISIKKGGEKKNQTH